MKPFDFKYGRIQETDNEKEENMILIVESKDEDFDSFQQEMEAAEMEEVIYLESFMVDSSTNMLVLIEGTYSYVCGFQKVNGDEYDMTGLRTITLAK
ncbi:hypothetical protein AVEN_52456-1 [Araneus ventricosus]|uniref:Uncharacterized protein n=1 Tax=Araneus ventricosus TaxID=182803 RepID=A0A4Y2CXF7_ARAVE|nr:hypothetical protein AVEN_52456-1 [Araneus ventricosus]